jgi:Haloacid dehalogenase-like hydrolase
VWTSIASIVAPLPVTATHSGDPKDPGVASRTVDRAALRRVGLRSPSWLESMPALIFDLDGTLVDTVYAHLFAWQRTLTEAGLPIDGWSSTGAALFGLTDPLTTLRTPLTKKRP